MPCISTSEQCNDDFETNLLLSTGTYPVSTHTQVSSGILLTKMYVLNYILIYNDQTTLRAGTRRHGVECRWAQRTGRKKKKKKGLGDAPEKRKKEKYPGDKCLLGLVLGSMVVACGSYGTACESYGTACGLYGTACGHR
jgi:hypothetical protein